MNKKITMKNIGYFLEGYKNLFLTELGSKPDYYKEQIAYRMSICNDTCSKKKECIYCGCKYPEKLYVNKSCNNGIKFPDIMDEENWNQFKELNGIK